MEVNRPVAGLPSRLPMETLPLQGKVFVRDLSDGETVDSFFLVRERTRREKRNGQSFMKVQLGDSTGNIEGVCWECSEELWSAAAPGTVVRVMGPYAVHAQYGKSLTIRRSATLLNENDLSGYAGQDRRCRCPELGPGVRIRTGAPFAATWRRGR